ncbi:protein phosphatase 2C domain-containing protein [Haloglycomyces albus]|uniref:protein phosphatase 2C domain-containing protein n=1 Tax=Haloglycomyces albus TaxID=526067 RepID=UPI00146FC1D9|nr:protein phosphatase 2C domain-containing protein [Haloglycomyces albus]
MPWYVWTLAANFMASYSTSTSLTTILKSAIAMTADSHAETCDIANPVTPGATVAAARWESDQVEYLVLGDAAVAWKTIDGQTECVADTRLDELKQTPEPEDVDGIQRLTPEYISTVRNKEGGFWVADSRPEAALQARTGSIDISTLNSLVLCSDGVSRLNEKFSQPWMRIIEAAEQYGPRSVIDWVRQHELEQGSHGSSKLHDDATITLVRF